MILLAITLSADSEQTLEAVNRNIQLKSTDGHHALVSNNDSG
ncbi:MAG: hypothetical protein JSC085_000231 [Candidatus Tokpelaia sp. JSC085]|nr:MAG: hypothetical protein JSC085_000231 [Candidatus Tokpelaia sp. JSC085]